MSDLAFHPRLITVTEANPNSVVTYNVQARQEDGTTLIDQRSYPAATPPDIHTVLPIGDPLGLVSIVGVGNTFTLFLQEVNSLGDTTNYVPVGDSEGHGVFTAIEIPDGAETAIVTI